MKRSLFFLPLFILVVLVVVLFEGLFVSDKNSASPLVDHPFPAFSLPDLQDSATQHTESLFRGGITVVNVWATWCSTCYIEHPFLMELKQQGVRLYGISYKDDDDKARQWLLKHGNPYRATIVDGKGQLAINLGVSGAPETFLVDSNGVILYRHQGDMNAAVWQHQFVPLIKQLQRGPQ